MAYTVLTEDLRKCKKQYSCEWCAEKIEAGEYANYRSYIFEGDFMHGRMHRECWEAMESENNENLESGWSPGDYKRGSTENR